MTNPQIESLEKVAKILAKVPEKFVFTGGATIVLYVDEIIRDELRSTKDVDCVVEIFSRVKYYQLSEKLREVGLAESTESNVMCRWQYEEMLIDIMPCGEEVLGFSNRWYVEGIKKSITYVLPSGRKIQIFPPLYLLASKVEAFLGRGESFYHSKDIEDIIVLLDGCEVLPQEFDNAAEDIKLFLQQWFQENIENLKDAAYNFSPTSNSSRDNLVIELIEKIAQSPSYKIKLINIVIPKKETLIKKLDEKLTAITYYTVTRGLNAKVPMKNSGIEWLDKIPEHWELKRLQYIGRIERGSNITTRQINDDGLFPVFNGNNLRGYYDSYTHDGDYILIGTQGYHCGKINYTHGKFWASDRVIIISPTVDFEIFWLGELLRIINLQQYSISTTIPRLFVNQISKLKIPYPPIPEQQEIANYLTRKKAEIDHQKTSIRQSIKFLEEYKKTLIGQQKGGIDG